MLLEILEEKRKKNPLHLKRLLKKVVKLPFWLQPVEPKRRPLILDKVCLMELGFSEIQAEILLALWEAGGKLPVWEEGTEDLCHELRITSSTIRKHLKKLMELGLVKINFNGKSEIVAVIPPKELYKLVKETIHARLQIMSKLFELKQKEFEEKGRNHKEIIPKGYKLSEKAKKDIMELKKSKKIICGFVVGKIENKGKNIIVEGFIPIETRSGPKIHFNPVWKDYHKVKKKLIKDKKWILGEFHTHPHDNSELHKKDFEKMKMLGRGIWWIIGKETICYFFSKENDKLKFTKICED